MSYCEMKTGKVVAQRILMHLAEEEFCTQDSPAPWTSFNLRKERYNTTEELPDWFNFQVARRKPLYVIENVTDESVRDMGFMHLKKMQINTERSSSCDRK